MYYSRLIDGYLTEWASHEDKQADKEKRHILICPLYAISQMSRLELNTFK